MKGTDADVKLARLSQRHAATRAARPFPEAVTHENVFSHHFELAMALGNSRF